MKIQSIISFFFALALITACKVQMEVTDNRKPDTGPDGGLVIAPPDSIPDQYAFGPRFNWNQIVKSDSAYSFATTGADNSGRWLDSMRWLPSGPFVSVNGDTLATRNFARTQGSGADGNDVDSTRLTQDSILVYYFNGVETGRDTIAGSDDQTLTYNGSGSLTIESGNTVDISDLLDNTDTQLRDSLIQDSILVYYTNGIEVGRDTISTADNLGNHTMTQNIQTNGNWISGDGGNEGVFVNGSGNVGVNTTPTTNSITTLSSVKINAGTLNMAGTDTYLGVNAGAAQVSSNNNTFLGADAGVSANSFQNSFFGSKAGRTNTSNRNTFLGAFSGENSTVGESVIIGTQAGRNSSSSTSVIIGSEAGLNASGNKNTIVGYKAGRNITNAQLNTILGNEAGQNINGGFNNTLIGNLAGNGISSGANNSLIGTANGVKISSGSANTIIGSVNAGEITTGNYNTIIGALAGGKIKGSSNTIIGYQPIQNDTSATGNVIIGNAAAFNSYNTTSSIFIGPNSGPSAAKSIISKLYISNVSGSPAIYGDLVTKNIGIGQEVADYSLDLGLRTGAVRFPVGTTAQRPTGAAGLLRYNSDITGFEGYYNAQWNTFPSLGDMTLAGISAQSNTTAKSLYTMTSGQDVEFRTSGGDPLLFLDETNGYVGISNSSPTLTVDVDGGIRVGGSFTNQFRMYSNDGREWNWGVGNGLGGKARMQYLESSTLKAELALANGINFTSYGSSGIVFDHPNSASSDPVYINLRNRVGIGINPPSFSDHLMIKENNTGNADANFISLIDAAGTTVAVWADGGEIGIGNTTPTASLHIKAGTATANTAPLKFTAGTNLTTPEAGAIEYDGTNLFATNSTATRYTIAKTLTATAALDFGSTAAQSSTDLTITVTGAADGDAVSLGVPNASVNANSSFSAWVSAANTVTVRFSNHSAGAIDPASGTFRVSVIKY